ncbi:MAG: cytochrome c biogenesis protein CcsA [Verrucomicrobiota bacterium]|nr:cytochrome c biogenesis protein CcsA [Verrucomicrobiota bacterium]
MAQWLLVVATALVVLGGALGVQAVRAGTRKRGTIVCMLLAFLCQLGVLGARGELRGKCPLGDYGEILAFLAWSLVLFYLVVGPAYRISLLGLFTAPVVAIFQLVALVPGVMDRHPVEVEEVDPWGEAHAAFSVLSYGAFALAAVAALMFLVLNKKLKKHQLGSSLFRNLPPVRSLLDSVVRLTTMGAGILTVGIVAAFMMERENSYGTHLVAAVVTWLAYLVVIGLHFWRGITPRRLSGSVIVLFVLSLLVFAFV